MRIVLFNFLLTLFCMNAFAETKVLSDTGSFAGRVSRITSEANLVRVKVDFDNVKYLNKKDRVEFWEEHNPNFHCKAYVAGKSSDYLLLKVPNIEDCLRQLSLGYGMYLNFFSKDLENNIKMGRQLMEILVKKRLAIQGKMMQRRKQLDAHIEKSDAINQRYKVLRDKLEAQWRDELALLEEDRIVALRNYKGLEVRLNEIDFKLEKYRITDENLSMDRWSLDPRLFFKK
ncbi:hypothetical protein [Halobacteriovorax sp. HLS]|uniref:hypothetical protein n=1 Tax=Halobacteriovorax sp. HLS TaxID=2234000 RepID=UPI000FDA279B|nr:hypothetical protein [Halobacteriovorax sp. HLS]